MSFDCGSSVVPVDRVLFENIIFKLEICVVKWKMFHLLPNYIGKHGSNIRE